jgi:hypothetical protein
MQVFWTGQLTAFKSYAEGKPSPQHKQKSKKGRRK